MFTKKSRFFGARFLSKLLAPLEKFLGSVNENRYRKQYKGGPFGSAGCRIPEKRGVHLPPPPKTAPDFIDFLNNTRSENKE